MDVDLPDGMTDDSLPSDPTLGKLDEIARILSRAYPDAPPRPWYLRLHERVQQFAKYIGVPALLIAAISPVTSLFETYRETANKQFLVGTYHTYASELLERGEVDRAKSILAELDTQEKRDVRTIYMLARLAAIEAIKQGRGPQLAEDRITLLLLLNRNAGPLFPSLGGADEIVDLDLALVDIGTQTAHLAEAQSRLDRIESEHAAKDSLFVAKHALRSGTILVIRSQLEQALEVLAKGIALTVPEANPALAAELHFQVGKAHQFSSDGVLALRSYAIADSLFARVNDRHSVVRTQNNIGMIYSDRRENARARAHFARSGEIARSLGDQLGIARSLVNVATIDVRDGNYDSGLKNQLAAQEAFRLADNKLGLASVLQGLANIYELRGNADKGVYYGSQALSALTDVGDVRGIANSAAVLGRFAAQLEDWSTAIKYAGAALAFRRGYASPDTSRSLREIDLAAGQLSELELSRAYGSASALVDSLATTIGRTDIVLRTPPTVARP